MTHAPASPPAPTPRGVKRLYQQAAAVLWALVAVSVLCLPLYVDSLLELALLLVGIPLAWLLVDIMSGVVHWSLDTYGTPQTPLIGPVIGDFRHHHVDQHAILDKGFLECCGGAALPAIPVLLLLHLAAWWTGSGVLLGTGIVFVSGCVLTNYIHRLAHLDRPHALVTRLQRWRVVLRPEEHLRHHSGDHRLGYGITSGWSNAMLERLAAYRRMERALARRARHRDDPR